MTAAAAPVATAGLQEAPGTAGAVAAAGTPPPPYRTSWEHLEEELVKNGFLRNREGRPSMVRNLRSLFQRAHCTEQELRTLHGVVTAFAGPRERVKPMELEEIHQLVLGSGAAEPGV